MSKICIGAMVVDNQTGALCTLSGESISLRYQASEVLKLLAGSPGEVVPRDVFLDRVWQGREGGDAGLAQCIADIRRAMGDSDRTIIETIPRQGYRLNADGTSDAPVRREMSWSAVAIVVALVSVIVLVAWVTRPDSPGSGRAVVAVLPFENLGPSDPQLPLGDSVSDDVITSLARYSEFDVTARQSSFRFRDPTRDLRDIAAQLGADYLVQGSQSVRDRTLRISVQLIEAEGLTVVWVDQFEVPLEEMFEVNDTIAYRIAHEISSSVVAINAKIRPSGGQVDALILDNRARVLFQSAPRQDSWLAALALSQQSIQSFPDSEWGYIGRALMLRIGVRFGWSTGVVDDLLGEAEALAQRAVELGPQNYMSHLALGRVLMQLGEIERATAALEAAADLNPSSVLVLNALAQTYIYSDRLDDVDRVAARIAWIDPIPDSVSIWMQAWAEWQKGNCEDALVTMQTMPVIPTEAMKLLAVIHACLGNVDAARAAASTFLERYPDWTLAREIETNAGNWVVDGPRDRWLAALEELGVQE